MTRETFLKQIGAGAAFVLTVPCFYACGKDDDGMEPTPPAEVDFTIDVTAAPYAASFAQRDFAIANEVVIARLADGSYAAASQMCSHEQNKAIEYDNATDAWFCSVHSARFQRASGTPANTVTDRPLRIYTTTLTGNLLRVT